VRNEKKENEGLQRNKYCEKKPEKNQAKSGGTKDLSWKTAKTEKKGQQKMAVNLECRCRLGDWCQRE